LVAVSVSVTVAPGTTAPDGSVTDPATVPVDVDCAQAGRALLKQSTAKQRRRLANREEKIWRRTGMEKPSLKQELFREDAEILAQTALAYETRNKSEAEKASFQPRNPLIGPGHYHH
jgi:hypothetical protein